MCAVSILIDSLYGLVRERAFSIILNISPYSGHGTRLFAVKLIFIVINISRRTFISCWSVSIKYDPTGLFVPLNHNCIALGLYILAQQ